MAICEDAPCCGCCGHTVWAAEARADEEWAQARWLEMDGPEPDEPGEITCPWCSAWTHPDTECSECGEFTSSEPRYSEDGEEDA
jgi:hypothetical protein